MWELPSSFSPYSLSSAPSQLDNHSEQNSGENSAEPTLTSLSHTFPRQMPHRQVVAVLTLVTSDLWKITNGVKFSGQITTKWKGSILVFNKACSNLYCQLLHLHTEKKSRSKILALDQLHLKLQMAPRWLEGRSTWCMNRGWKNWVCSAWKKSNCLIGEYRCDEVRLFLELHTDKRQLTNWTMRNSD